MDSKTVKSNDAKRGEISGGHRAHRRDELSALSEEKAALLQNYLLLHRLLLQLQVFGVWALLLGGVGVAVLLYAGDKKADIAGRVRKNGIGSRAWERSLENDAQVHREVRLLQLSAALCACAVALSAAAFAWARPEAFRATLAVLTADDTPPCPKNATPAVPIHTGGPAASTGVNLKSGEAQQHRWDEVRGH